jgi:hypothetical protein
MNLEAANPDEEKPSVTLPGTVEKILPALGTNGYGLIISLRNANLTN